MASVAYATTGDINGDGLIGLEETIYSLQVVAGDEPQPVESSDNFYPVYDAENVFVAYQFVGSPEALISPQNYYAKIDARTGNYERYDTFFTTTDCSGEQYSFGPTFTLKSVFIDTPKKCIFRNTYGEILYIPSNALAVSIGSSGSRLDSLGQCIQGSFDAYGVYQVLPNDSAVTGFQNNYAPPLEAQLNIPPAP